MNGNTVVNRSKRTSNQYVYAAPSSIHQTGLFARTAIAAGTDIVEYDGPRVLREEGEKMAAEGNVYVFLFDRKTCIDGSVGWNLARFANHSCAPNCKSVKISGGIWLRTLRPLAKGEEITYDYGYSFREYRNNPCACGAKNCAGYIVPERYRDRVREE
jgi:SET domain-containing protein